MRFANCCPLLTLFMHFPSDLFFPSSCHSLLSLFLEIFKLALAFHLFKISQCLPNLFSKMLSSLNAWTMLQSFPSDPHLCSQLELLKPVCSNFLQSNQSGYSPFDPVNQSAILTSVIILQGSPLLASIAVLSPPCAPWRICLLTSPVVEVTGKPKITLHNSNNGVRKIIFLVSSFFGHIVYWPLFSGDSPFFSATHLSFLLSVLISSSTLVFKVVPLFFLWNTSDAPAKLVLQISPQNVSLSGSLQKVLFVIMAIFFFLSCFILTYCLLSSIHCTDSEACFHCALSKGWCCGVLLHE